MQRPKWLSHVARSLGKMVRGGSTLAIAAIAAIARTHSTGTVLIVMIIAVRVRNRN